MTSTQQIQYLSAPAEVSMADRWFEVAALDHFWIQRRFDVFRKLAGRVVAESKELAEIGCGHGLLQRQVEETYNRGVQGFDLNEFALKQNVCRLGTRCCYDISHQQPELRGRFDLIFLFDVLEHIEDESRFLDAVAFHLAPGGRLIINVPAGQWAYSAYDRAAGHQRRYSIKALRASAARGGFNTGEWTYWGLPLLPAVILRKLWLMGRQDESNIISAGFDSRSSATNRMMAALSKCEPLPQKVIGTSLMAVLQFDPSLRRSHIAA